MNNLTYLTCLNIIYQIWITQSDAIVIILYRVLKSRGNIIQNIAQVYLELSESTDLI